MKQLIFKTWSYDFWPFHLASESCPILGAFHLSSVRRSKSTLHPRYNYRSRATATSKCTLVSEKSGCFERKLISVSVSSLDTKNYFHLWRLQSDLTKIQQLDTITTIHSAISTSNSEIQSPAGCKFDQLSEKIRKKEREKKEEHG